ncbi:MAG TPA: M1 family peptidase, partial [Candidatus Kryptonia bacterium]|nr:M1 family peptidase [Candidatus Kryptonia bacterium]
MRIEGQRRAARVIAPNAAVAGFLLWLMAASVGAAPLSSRIANYDIDARLDTANHRVTAREVLMWRNTGGEPAGELYFHLYLNAFANTRSSFIREMRDSVLDWQRDKPDGWGYQEIATLRVDGNDRIAAIEYVHPDDDNAEDRTVIRIPLDTPIAAGATARIEIEFTAQLPKVLARSGYAGPFVFIAQWFPKIGVFEDGTWNCHQYHLATEFYADFGTYDVRLTVPRTAVVGATGVRQDQRDNPDGTQTVHYRAEDVHDFAWTVDPRFLEVTDRFDAVNLRLLVQPLHRGQALRYLDAVKQAMR